RRCMGARVSTVPAHCASQCSSTEITDVAGLACRTAVPAGGRDEWVRSRGASFAYRVQGQATSARHSPTTSIRRSISAGAAALRGRAPGSCPRRVRNCGYPCYAELPNAHPLGGSEVQLLTGFHVERGVPRVEIAQGQRAIGSRREDVGDDLTAERRLAELGAQVLRETQKESLFGGEAADDRRWLTLQRKLVCITRGGEAAQVGDVFGRSLLPVDMQPGQRFVG